MKSQYHRLFSCGSWEKYGELLSACFLICHMGFIIKELSPGLKEFVNQSTSGLAQRRRSVKLLALRAGRVVAELMETCTHRQLAPDSSLCSHFYPRGVPAYSQQPVGRTRNTPYRLARAAGATVTSTSACHQLAHVLARARRVWWWRRSYRHGASSLFP